MRAKKVDVNQAKIVAGLRAHDFSVALLHEVGRGVPDLVIGKDGKDRFVEVKAPGGDLNKDQTEFHKNWRGSPIIVAYSLEDILIAF